MAEKLLNPVDHFSGLPRLILPYSEAPTGSIPAEAPAIDDHHPGHPRVVLLSMEEDGGDAVRHSRVQTTYWADHHEPAGYHGRFSRPEKLPTTATENFEISFWSWTGYVPEMGIDIRASKDKDLFVRLNEEQKHQLWLRREVRVERPELVRAFMTRFVISQSLEAVAANVIDEFLNTTDIAKQRKIGHRLITEAIAQATATLEFNYRRARKKELIKPVCPPTAAEFVRARIAHPKRRPELTNRLREELQAA